MKRRVIACLIGLIVILAGVLLFTGRTPSEAELNRQLSEEFIACLPSELPAKQHQEITGIFDRFFHMAATGAIDSLDQRSVQQELKNHILVGRISQKDLEHFMARVSYLTYKSNPNANLPDGVIDHPILNPDTIQDSK
jgi:hypothetical protein